ncbi:metallophosphoesterase [Agrobacterium sp. SHOUNA12C]|uniref:Calcineurin-like phosphoesterase domain-containing protein n=1 Tax=Rhizobium rhizogenes NBRC 13257 TaxID=1220581 RepID=A0AA87Q4L0_RHIRH|nr:metallophosphoesterase [Rhizobium rhizogenes]KAA6491291.1 phosphatase [Agrobacterium sp. ICMP 7243]MCJ9722877.1 metallophosphoesterase [Agrobacterium sp. BETTINA12B]MCJ9760552.1 metallophosphoesterase [Agrobacterium sp. SHOUNA12C]OCJ02909.1 phosphatase [Agrobacterium sp. 13-626]NTF47778.1 phosphatase [Rhizobium rhizogenes]
MSSPSAPIFRFGVVADPQYAALEPNLELDRYPAKSLAKLKEAITEFNRHDLAFVVTLGDIIDRNWQSFDDILPVYETLRHERYFLLGNHDFAVAPEHLAKVANRVGLSSAYYDFARAGYRFIALDGNEISLFASPEGDPRRDEAKALMRALNDAGAPNSHRWNGAISDTQYAWLATKLNEAKAAGEKVVVMNHYPVFPENSHNAIDSERLLALFAEHDHVIAYLNGHNHAGNFGVADGTYFVNFKGMVDTEDNSAYAIVTVYEDRLEIIGFGREESRVLALH